MQKEQRLRHRKDFAAVYRQGRIQSNQILVLRVSTNGTATTRFGFVAGKVVGGAVVRNRVKRRLREAMREIGAVPGLDIVVGARKPAAAASFAALRQGLYALMKRSAILPTATAERQQE